MLHFEAREAVKVHNILFFSLLLKTPKGWSRPQGRHLAGNHEGSSVGKESTCNEGDPSSIPGLGSSPGEGISYPLQYSQASLVAQMVKNACNDGDPSSIPRSGSSPGEKNAKPLQYSCLENPHGERSLAGYSPRGHKQLDMTEWLSTPSKSGKSW